MMGSPLGPTLANLFLAHMEQQWMSMNFSPILYRRYVDDIFCVFENESDSKNFFVFINQQHQNLKFTFEEGENNTLPFLDVNIIMKDDEFETHIYRKTTFTGLLLNFHAMCPEQWKKGLILGLLHRAYTVCSSWTLFHEEVTRIISLLADNGYSYSYVQNIIKKFIDHKINPDSSKKDTDSDKVKPTFKLPYIGYPSLLLKRKISKMFSKRGIMVNVVFSTFKVRNYFSLKDKSSRLLRSCLVYKFQCLDDPNKSYIGKTKRYLNRRIHEHQKPGSAIHNHLLNCESCTCPSGLESSFSVLVKGNSDFDLQILEALLITDERPSLNKQLASDGVSYVLNVF